MDISVIQNNLGMWICAAFMIAIILIQAVLYLKLSRKEATTLGLPAEQQKEAMRSAAVTAVGPALALSIMLITLMTTLGGPTAWMRMNDVGSGRSELAIASMVSDMVTAAEGTPEWDLQNFSYAVWAQGIDVAIGHSAENLKDCDLVIRTAAIHDENPEIAGAIARGIPVYERAQAWGAIMQHYENAVCFSGTHGKTPP